MLPIPGFVVQVKVCALVLTFLMVSCVEQANDETITTSTVSAETCQQMVDAQSDSTDVTIPPGIRDVQGALDAIERVYPEQLRTQGVGGEVQLAMLIDTTGIVASTRIANTSGSVHLDSAAVEASQWFRFSPAYVVDRPTCHWLTLPVRFTPER